MATLHDVFGFCTARAPHYGGELCVGEAGSRTPCGVCVRTLYSTSTGIP
jgi:hypothetical protein